MKRPIQTISLGLLHLGVLVIAASGFEATVPDARTMLLRSPIVMGHLVLDDGQRQRLGAVLDLIDYPLWKLRDRPHLERGERVEALLGQLDAAAGRIMTANQRLNYNALILAAQGAERTRKQSIDWAQVEERACRAPELAGVSAWINSPELTLASQRGRVVVLHFFAIDCGNCVANLPHYNRWYEAYEASRVKIIGIHRPETSRERSVDHVRAKLAKYVVTHPVLIDNDSKNWDAWANQVWPSIYLIDKAGFVRYWWYGELEYQGRGGNGWMRKRINELQQENP